MRGGGGGGSARDCSEEVTDRVRNEHSVRFVTPRYDLSPRVTNRVWVTNITDGRPDLTRFVNREKNRFGQTNHGTTI